MQSEDIRKIIEQECEDYYLGFADLSLKKEDIDENYKSLVCIYPRAISIGITLPFKVTDIPDNVNNEFYHTTNQKLNSITSFLSSSLEDEGYKALALPKEGNVNNGIFVSLHNLAASRADLGMIKNNTIITPEVGQRVNWGTVITDAPLNARI
jgi:epoxyqueuosine reductase QueG